MRKRKIEPNAWYSLSELVTMSAFGWIKPDIRGYRRYVQEDANGKKLLSPIVIGSHKSKRYTFKGSNIIRFISHMEKGNPIS